jgi:lipoprotein-anchoring transpeptidase ErfK/SrfK
MASEVQSQQSPRTTRVARLRLPVFRSALALAAISAATQLSAQTLQMVQPEVIVSVREQKLMLLADGARVATFPVSTSKFGLGDNWNSMATPLGTLQVAQKIGDHAPVGAVFRNRRFTGEILQPNAPGRDPVITRIIWLRGLQAENARAFSRCIYIHGTPEEKTIGRPASYGCIRMKSADVAALYAQLPIGAIVQITPDALPKVKTAPKDKIVSSQSIKPAQQNITAFTTNKPAAEKTAVTPLPKTQTAPARKSDATAWVRNARA